MVEEVEERAGCDYDHDEGGGDPEGAVQVWLFVEHLAEGAQCDGGTHSREDLLFLHIEVVPISL